MLTLMILAPRPGKCPNGCPIGVKTTFGIWENINLLTFLCSVQGEVYCDRTRWFRIDDPEVKRNFRTARCGDLAGRAQRVAHRPELCHEYGYLAGADVNIEAVMSCTKTSALYRRALYFSRVVPSSSGFKSGRDKQPSDNPGRSRRPQTMACERDRGSHPNRNYQSCHAI